MIEAVGLTKRYGDKLAVDQLSFSVKPGQVTGFLGPNGAGKSTTMRMILGLDAPTSGSVTIGGRPFADAAYPLREVGALLDAKAVHGGRSAYNHLLCLAQSNNLPKSRVDEALALVGLGAVAKKRSKGFSLGMGQRLGIAAALLGDPKVLMFDEPVNGLDPEGILWIRNLMKALAAEGRTVFVSSHLMSEMEATADHLIVIGRGKLVADCTVQQFIDNNSELSIRIKTPELEKLTAVLSDKGGNVRADGEEALLVSKLGMQEIGDLAFDNQIRVHELSPIQASLEQAFMELTKSSVEYHAAIPAGKKAPRTMTALTDAPIPTTFPGMSPLPEASGKAGFGGALRSEWTKIKSVKSTIWTLAAAIVISVGISTLGNWGQASHTSDTAAQLRAGTWSSGPCSASSSGSWSWSSSASR